MDRQRFGDLAQQLGLLTAEQVEHALRIQQEEDAAGTPRRPLGLICMQEGYLQFDQVMAVLARQQQSPAQV
ncbi:MAG: hypothetical protein ACO1SX_29190 [Actinomycetota bacterium]